MPRVSRQAWRKAHLTLGEEKLELGAGDRAPGSSIHKSRGEKQGPWHQLPEERKRDKRASPGLRPVCVGSAPTTPKERRWPVWGGEQQEARPGSCPQHPARGPSSVLSSQDPSPSPQGQGPLADGAEALQLAPTRRFPRAPGLCTSRPPAAAQPLLLSAVSPSGTLCRRL